ncbi:MAG: hypothetical protein Q9208_008439 [Pyrenodesmia sp. 3 TL-2023]
MEVGVGVGIAASTITIFKVSCTLASQVKELVQSAKLRRENLKELEDKLGCLKAILAQANALYGSDEDISCSTSKQELRTSLKNVVNHCKNDLTRFEAELKDLLKPGNWVIVALRQKAAGPAFVKIRASISDHQQELSLLVQLLDKGQAHQTSIKVDRVIEMLEMLTNTPTQSTTADSMLSQVTTALNEREDLEGEEHSDTAGTQEVGKEPECEEGNLKGRDLLEAIEGGKHNTFESLLHDGNTSLKEKDSKDRTPSLLAAHLGQGDMLKKLVNINDQDKVDGRGHSDVQRESSTTNETIPSCETEDDDKGPEDTSHRQIDFNATDIVGRTALHYCAEYDMCDIAKLLLDHGVDINARDNGKHPPVYYAAKHRKYSATKLLLLRGASTGFEWPRPTSFEIEQLLKEHANNDPSAPTSSPASSRHSTVSTPSSLQKRSGSIVRRSSSAKQ